MKRKFLKIFIVIIVISLCLTFYIINTNSTKHADTIELRGADIFWKASLNIHFNHNSELIIRPVRDNFEIPSKISIDIIVNNNCVYTGTLKYILSSSNKSYLGRYMVVLNSDDYFKKGIKEAYIIIKFNDKISTISLDKLVKFY